MKRTTDSRKRILVVAPLPPPMGGVEHAMEQLLRSTLTQKFSITKLNPRIRRSNKERGHLNLSGIRALFALCLNISRVLAVNRHKLVYLPISSNRTGFARDAILILLIKLTRRKIVTHYHGGNFDNFYRHSTRLDRILIRFVLRRVDTLVVLGDSIKGNFKGIYPESKAIEAVPNGVNPNEFARCSTHCSGSDDSAFRIFYLGNVSFVKGFYDLMVVYKRLFQKFPYLRLSVAGEIITVDQERNILRDYFPPEIQERMDRSSREIDEFLGEAAKYGATYFGVIDRQTKMKLLTEATVFILPSYSEGFSMSVLEAMASGLPVVTTNVGAMSDVVEDGRNGYVVRPGDSPALEEKLSILIGDRKLCREMGLRSIEIVNERFDIEEVARRLGDIFDKAISSPGKSASGKAEEIVPYPG